MEGFLGLSDSHEARAVVLMVAGNDDNPTAICPIVYLPHTEFVMAGCQAIADNGGEKGGCDSTVFQRRVRSIGQRKLQLSPSRTALGRRSVAFWTDDPNFRLRPKVANPGAISALAEKPHRKLGPNFSDVPDPVLQARSSAFRR